MRETVLQLSSSRTYGFDQSTLSTAEVNYDSLYNLLPNGTSRITDNQVFGKTTDRFRSIYGNLSYTYKQRYILSMSARVDKSNLFGVKTNQKSVPLWSTGFKWALDRENFYKIGLLKSLAKRL